MRRSPELAGREAAPVLGHALTKRGEHADPGDDDHRPAGVIQIRLHRVPAYAAATKASASPRWCPHPVTRT